MMLYMTSLGVAAEEFLLSEFWEDDQVLPEVLTATRLKQPRAETPASVTIIEAEQIEAWGVRSIPEALRFVPGMFTGHSNKENSANVVYHAGTQNIMRRMQVLIDGRSVYKAAIARIIWDDIPVAVEDIQRIEVIRGPSSAAYGANAFMATVNIITKDPNDTLGTRLRYRRGNQGVDDRFASHSAEVGKGAYRLTTNSQKDDGFDGSGNGSKDRWNDDSRHQFINFALQQQLTTRTQLHLDAGFDDTYADIANSNSKHETQYRDSQTSHAQVRFDFDFSSMHQSQLQVYWQREQREHFNRSRVLQIALDPRLREIYEKYSESMIKITEFASSDSLSDKDKAQILGLISEFSPEEQAFLLTTVVPVLEIPNELQDDYKVYGTFDYGYSERRSHIEWQDIFVWHPNFRTVSGVSARYDEAQSPTFFGGKRRNTTYQAFANGEWRVIESLLFNLGGMYEHDELTGGAFSPRAAANLMLTPKQSVRLVLSEAVRSPDMLEQRPGMVVKITDLSPKYLDQSEGIFFLTNVSNDKGLKHEKIRSYELGYYGALFDNKLELDIKLYRDRLTQLISGDPTNVDEPFISNDSNMTIKGAEAQLNWSIFTKDWIWLTMGYMDIEKDIAKERDYCIETCLSPRKSTTLSWHHGEQSWSSTLSYFWLNGFAENQNIYHRGELNLRKEWKLKGITPWLGGLWQYQFANTPLGYDNQKYSSRNIFYLQAGLNF